MPTFKATIELEITREHDDDVWPIDFDRATEQALQVANRAEEENMDIVDAETVVVERVEDNAIDD